MAFYYVFERAGEYTVDSDTNYSTLLAARWKVVKTFGTREAAEDWIWVMLKINTRRDFPCPDCGKIGMR